MKKQFTLVCLLVAFATTRALAGGPSAPYRFDSTFGNNGFLVDTTTGGTVNSYIYFNEIMVSTNVSTLNQFWVGGITNGRYLANKYSATGAQLLTRTGTDYSEGKGETGVMLFNKIYISGQQTNGGGCQSISYNFDGTPNAVFNQTAGADSFLSEVTYAPHTPLGLTFPNCSGVLGNGHIVTVVYKPLDSTYIAEFDPTAAGGTTPITHPQFTNANNNTRVKALRVIPGTNSYVVLVYDAGLNASFLYCIANGNVYATYQYNGVQYNALVAISNNGMMLGGDNLRFVDITNGNLSTPNAFAGGVQQLVRDPQTGEIYAFTGTNLLAITPSGDADDTYNPDGLGNNFAYAPITAGYLLGVPSGQIYFSDMEMQGSDILISGYTTQLNGSNVATGFAGFVMKVRGKGSVANPCASFSVQLDSVYATGIGSCDYAAHITLSGAFPMTAAISWGSGGNTVTVNSSPYIPTGLCPATYEILFEDQNNCTALVNFVSPPPPTCTVPEITTQLSGTTGFCEGTPIQLGALTITGTPTNYQWYRNGVAIIGAEQNVYYKASANANDEGAYYLIASNACGADTSNTGNVTVTENAKPVVQQFGNELYATGATTGATLVWYLDGNVIQGATTSPYLATQNGVYSVQATVGGCVVTSDGATVVVSGVNDLTGSADWQIYPNPVAERLYVTVSTGVRKLEILNLIGEVVGSVAGNINSIGTGNLPTGIYVARITTTAGIATKKFSKQ